MQGGWVMLSLSAAFFGMPSAGRAQEPKPPFPYLVRLVRYPGGAAGVTLAGTLTEPKGRGPFPAVVLIAGSGPNNRDESSPTHKPFLVLADYLTRRGVAVLRYDKRGVGESTGNFNSAAYGDFADDAQAGVKYLQTLPKIAHKRIGLIGHSEGGLVAPIVAARSRNVAFLVLLAGIALTGEQWQIKQDARDSRAKGMSEAAITRSETQEERGFAQAKSRKAIPPAFLYLFTYDPAPVLRKVKCPTLALDGSKDRQVPPEEDLAAIKAALKVGRNRDFTVRELPGLNHMFQTARTGSPSEYSGIKETFAPAALKIIGDWIAARTWKK